MKNSNLIFKIIIGIVGVGAIAILVYFLAKPAIQTDDLIMTPTRPASSLTMDDVKLKVFNEIENADTNSFCVAAYNEVYNTINLYFSNNSANRKTVLNYLNDAYSKTFVKQANHVFNGTEWTVADMQTIRNELKRIAENNIASGYAELDELYEVIAEYDSLRAFDQAISSLCSRHANDYEATWNTDLTYKLIYSIPEAETRAINSPYYTSTRKDTVLERLYAGHIAFVESMIKLGEKDNLSRGLQTRLDWKSYFSSYDSAEKAYQDNIAKWNKISNAYKVFSSYTSNLYGHYDYDHERNLSTRLGNLKPVNPSFLFR